MPENFNTDKPTEAAVDISNQIVGMAEQLEKLARENEFLRAGAEHGDFFIMALTVFILACFVGYYVVWRVTPALHSPLMGITNAISSVIIVGAILSAGAAMNGFASTMGFLAVILASINIFGGFIITNRMLSMFKKKKG